MLGPDWLRENCQDIIRHKKNIWVAYSGGVDSHVLLNLVKQTFPNVQALHINHGLDIDDDLWQQHCEQVCAALQVPLRCIKARVKAKPKQSPEDAARVARRAAWQQALSSDDVLFVAHHADDQAETILYRLFRGAGPKGLSGMHMRSQLGVLNIYRPLLNISKQEILDYAQQQNLFWIDDKSNANTDYDRNYIRNQLMPLVTKRWPAAVKNINRAGILNTQLLQCVDPTVKQKLQSVYGAKHREIDLNRLKKHSSIWRREILRAWLQEHGYTPAYTKLELIEQQVIAARIDANPQLVLGNFVIRRSKDKLYILNAIDFGLADQQLNFPQEWDLQNDLLLPNGRKLNIREISDNPDFIAKLQQHAVVVKMSEHGAKAKKVFQQHSIPSWERDNYPLIFADGRLVAIVGLWASPRF